jgi:hypothetical protein
VRATNLSNAERDRNLEMLRFISDETAARGLEFQLGIWTHAFVWQNSPNVNHVIEGLTPDRHAASPVTRWRCSEVLPEHLRRHASHPRRERRRRRQLRLLEDGLRRRARSGRRCAWTSTPRASTSR